MRLIRCLLPADVRVAETRGDFGRLLEPESDYFRAASAKRLREATTVRACARSVLEEFGFPDHVLVPGPNGASRWPDALVGSMTHCRGFRAAAVGLRQRYEAIGIDVEPALPLSEAALQAIRRPEEEPSMDEPLWSKTLFSAKEASLKAWSAAGLGGLDLMDISVSIYASGYFASSVPSRGIGDIEATVIGHWVIRNGFVATAVVIYRPIAGAIEE